MSKASMKTLIEDKNISMKKGATVLGKTPGLKIANIQDIGKVIL